jgi:hypothetical protein
MTVVVTHSTPSDSSFSTTGAAAWDASHTLSGVGTMAGQDSNAVAITGGSISGVSGVVTSVTGTAPVASSGGATPAISMAAATTSVSGYLTSTDWNTFNGKGSGSVTSVGGTGTVNGLSLSGTVTSSGSLTFGGTLDLSSPPAIGGTAAAEGTFTTLTSTGQTSLGGVTGSEGLRVNAVAGSTNWLDVTGSSANRVDVTALGPAGSNVALRLSSRGSQPVNFYTVAQTVLQFSVASTASAVNYVQVTGAVTGGNPSIVSAGSDGAIGLSLSSKSTSSIFFYTNNLSANSRQLDITHTGTVVNRFQLTGAQTGFGVTLGVNGSDTNISQVFQSKGTGAIDLAAGSSGVNISNGGTVTAITRTVQGSLYTSVPSLAISAPTTSGGVQATATANLGVTAVAIAGGGTGYTVADTLTVVGGTGTAAQLTVGTVSSGVITSISVAAQNGIYSVFPTSPVSVTGGTGSGATFNISGGILSTFTITNAGSGYVEQPTITFSGGGGSGAAAYAGVGSGTVVRSLGSTMSFYSPNGETFRIIDNTTASGALWAALSGLTQSELRAINASAGAAITNAGAFPILFRTNTNTEQLRVSHTASAVNYVQVTGAATGNNPVISTQGSDGARGLAFWTKGSTNFNFFSNSGSNTTFVMNGNAGTAVNYLQVANSATTVAPNLSAQGTDTDISLSLVPKGLGIVLMNQQTPTAVTATGTLTIANLLTQIITSTSATAVSLTLPTGTLSDAGVSGGTSAANTSFDWSIINTGSASGDVTLVAGTAHTIVGSATVTVGTSGKFRSRKTATNTFITYRV